MTKKYTVMWVAEISASNPEVAAIKAHHTITNATSNYFDIYDNEAIHQVEIPNNGTYLNITSHPYSPYLKTNNKT